MIVFIANFPNEEEIKDGMAQRIMAIDNEFSNQERIYIAIAPFRHLKAHTIRNNNVTVYYLNSVLHVKKIILLLKKAKIIYCHSLYNFYPLIPALLLSRGKYNMTLDAHGIVPEEQMLEGRRFKAILCTLFERYAFLSGHLNNVIAVSNQMILHFTNKYKTGNRINYIVKPIFSTNTLRDVSELEAAQLRKELRIGSKDIIFIYSGNMQKWQNVPLIKQFVEKDSNPHHVFIILTRDKTVMMDYWGELINCKRIIIDSVQPEDLGAYYQISDYGFIIRDASTVNVVASPTKLIEYLYYGITPIVKSSAIGDAESMGYEYVIYDSHETYTKHKSEFNRNIANNMLLINNEAYIPDILGKCFHANKDC